MRSHPDEEAYQRTWSQEYQPQNYSRGLAALVLRDSHKIIERDFGADVHLQSVLEVGAGDGAHLDFVKHGFDMYTLTDSSSAMLEQARLRHAGRPNVKFAIMNARSLNVASESVDRLIATHVLERLNDPHLVLEEWNRV